MSQMTTDPNHISRRAARRIALAAAYAAECSSDSKDEILEELRTMREDWTNPPELTISLLKLAFSHAVEIEQQVIKVLENWRLERIAPVERALLKLGCAEILYCPEIPPRVTINEYIELAKVFANENAPAFINGILDKLVQNSRKQDFHAAPR
jgi:transcription antitermination protein NusB